MGCKTSQKMKENMVEAREGKTNGETQARSERQPIEVGNIYTDSLVSGKGPKGAGTDKGVANCRNFSRASGAAGPSQLTREVGQPGR